jgi:hypothetical protein
MRAFVNDLKVIKVLKVLKVPKVLKVLTANRRSLQPRHLLHSLYRA